VRRHDFLHPGHLGVFGPANDDAHVVGRRRRARKRRATRPQGRRRGVVSVARRRNDDQAELELTVVEELRVGRVGDSDHLQIHLVRALRDEPRRRHVAAEHQRLLVHAAAASASRAPGRAKPTAAAAAAAAGGVRPVVVARGVALAESYDHCHVSNDVHSDLVDGHRLHSQERADMSVRMSEGCYAMKTTNTHSTREKERKKESSAIGAEMAAMVDESQAFSV
jgi:hypothetical protein